MTPTDFTSRCEAIYGPGWQSALARDLVRDPRTVRRWKTGESPVPKVVQEWMLNKEKRAAGGSTQNHDR